MLHLIAITLSKKNEKRKKLREKEPLKQELIRLIKPYSQGGVICNRCISLTAYFYCFLALKHLNSKFQKANEASLCGCCIWIY